jgi:hypothetical protein
VTNQQYMFSNADKFNSVLNFRGSVAKSARKYLLYNAHEYVQQSCLDGCDSTPYDPSNPSCYDSSYSVFYTRNQTITKTGAEGKRDSCGVCGGDNSTCSGCTNSTANNYDPDATVDDGSCACEPEEVLVNGECKNAADVRHFNNNQLNYALQTTCCTESGFLNDCTLDENYALSDEGLHISLWDTSEVTSMYRLINNLPTQCRNTFNANISYWDTSKVTNMEGTFDMASVFNQELHWDTSKVTNMMFMFGEANQFNKPLVWNTSKVTDMRYMFYKNVNFNQPLDWDTSSVTNMGYCGSKTVQQTTRMGYFQSNRHEINVLQK